jgi:hypothetical protein
LNNAPHHLEDVIATKEKRYCEEALMDIFVCDNSDAPEKLDRRRRPLMRDVFDKLAMMGRIQEGHSIEIELTKSPNLKNEDCPD